MIREVRKTDYPALMDIWESAVLNTHDFLEREDFLYYKENLPAYFRHAALYGFEQDGRLAGFMGVAGRNIEMLFVHNDWRGKEARYVCHRKTAGLQSRCKRTEQTGCRFLPAYGIFSSNPF